MKKFFFIIFNVILIIFVSVVKVDSFEPFLLNVDRSALDLLQLPTAKIPSLANENTISACPATSLDKKNLENISKKFYQVKHCLFKTVLDVDKDHDCVEEVKPSLHLEYNELTNEPVFCGNSYRHQLHKMGFYFCDTVDVLAQLQDANNLKTPEKFIKPRFFPIYELCIDVSKKRTLWTKHNILTPELFHDADPKKLRDEKNPKAKLEIGTDTLYSAKFTFTEEYFERLKEKFANQNKPTPSKLNILRKQPTMNMKAKFYKMDETFIVPKDHIALRLWRKAANHLINVAAFWNVNSALMVAVNKRIKKLAFKYHSLHQKLTIYTRIRTFTSDEHGSRKNNMDFRQNVWIKLLYEERTKSAAWITLQNTPRDTQDLIECAKPAACETMKDWNRSGGRDEGDTLVQGELEYAKCCHPSESEIRSIFFMHLKVIGRGLDLDQEC